MEESPLAGYAVAVAGMVSLEKDSRAAGGFFIKEEKIITYMV
ncbi:hypothetical protein BJV85_003290 [Clostridium acetobutylicum]|nr:MULTISPECIES: hypothetical protein [Clostridium]NOV89527.1 hypothetical protein [Clostridium acetobutylicum]NOW15943.1 hypothetical protein [Clostridium acetobutylicum]NRY57622.1 hypothetical protein [Clostridium acetobutylicum]NSA94367.1 hypothetical protein [Clostridium acetobutylicum]NYC95518.1 hypothetical protein [Clostridium acetobutylicum]